jgi:hypothetical protein
MRCPKPTNELRPIVLVAGCTLGYLCTVCGATVITALYPEVWPVEHRWRIFVAPLLFFGVIFPLSFYWPKLLLMVLRRNRPKPPK